MTWREVIYILGRLDEEAHTGEGDPMRRSQKGRVKEQNRTEQNRTSQALTQEHPADFFFFATLTHCKETP